MNYAGKFGSGDLAPFSGADIGSGPLLSSHGHLPSHGKLHVDKVSTHAPSDAIIVPDAHLLFSGHFKRSGVDLILSSSDREVVLRDYFKGEKRAALASPDGAHLTGDIVNALSGYTQFAQADGSPSVAPPVIGHVTKLTGNATAIRNGVSIILNQGETVHKGDVVQSGSDSTLGITFIDGTVFGLASNARMVLNEMVYDPDGSDNKSLLSLVQGTISFVAGATAKKGDMKVDTPVATMGIRGTAVLVEIDFEVPGSGIAPPAKFQVLVEPDGTTGSYILFDKTTLTPIATVNRAGTQTIINGQGTVSFQSSVQLSPDAQKIISDVFSLKFTDLNNPNTKLTTNFTDSIIPETLFVKLAGGEFIPVTLQLLNIPSGATPPVDPGPPPRLVHIPGPPQAAAFGGTVSERIDVTASSALDSISGSVNYLDINPGDTPSVSTQFSSFAYQNAQGADVTATLTAQQQAAIKAVEVPLSVVQDPNGKNFGTATWTYNIADGAFDFLAAGETLKLTYMARVDNNYAPFNETTFVPFTIVVTGTNDKPTISATGGQITERIGTGNTAINTVSGTVTFGDVDLTDRPVVSVAISATDPFRYYDAQDNDVTEALTAEQMAAIQAVLVPLTVVQAAGNSHNGSAMWTYSIADSAFDFIADGETLNLNYVARVDDGHGGIISTPVTVSIHGGEVVVIGTNDVPTIVDNLTTATGAVTEDEAPTLVAGGTVTFQDLDLTDTHAATFVLKSSNANANLPGYSEAAPLSAIGTFALTSVSENPGVTTIGSIGWSFALNNNDPVLQSLAVGQTITQVYAVTFDDHHGGTVTQDVTVTITGNNDAPTIVAGAATTASGGVTEDIGVVSGNIGTSGTIAFRDVDLIDTHTAAFALKSSDASADLPGFAEGNGPGAAKIGAFALTMVNEVNDDTVNTASLGWTFTLDNNDLTLQSLALNQTITQIYTVTVSDGHGGTVLQDVTVTITGTNDAPTIVAGAATTASGGVTEDTGLVSGNIGTSGTIAFRDVDLIDTHTAAFALKSSDASADLPGFAEGNGPGAAKIGAFALTMANEVNDDTVNTASLGWTFTLDNNDPTLQSLALNQTITQIYTVTVSDGHGGTVLQDVTVTITGTNDAPTIVAGAATTASGGVAEDTGVVSGKIGTSGTIAFQDIDLIDTHTASFALKSSDASADLPGFAEGTGPGAAKIGAFALTMVNEVNDDTVNTASLGWTFTLDNNDPTLQSLALNQTITQIYTVTVSDGHGGTVLQDVTVVITGTNDAPTLADVTTAPFVDTAIDDSFSDLTGTLAGNDVDSGETTTLKYAAIGTAGATNSAVSGQYGSLTVDQYGNYIYVPDADAINELAAGTTDADTFTIQTKDVHGAVGTATLTVKVEGANDAPVIGTDVVVTEHVDETTTFSGLYVTDADATGSTFAMSATTGASPVTSVTPANGSGLDFEEINATLDSGIAYLHDTAEPQTDMVTLTVADSFGGADTVNFIFNHAGTGPEVTLNGTSGKDVIFATGYADTLTGGEGADQFVFTPEVSPNTDTIMNFAPGRDHIDLRAFAAVDSSTVSNWLANPLNQINSTDVRFTLDTNDTVILKNVVLANLHASDFIVSPH
ncbi:VCBS domain-containing protein [Bradyrhizobium sp. sGM-13]|uniref:VCBS domain-containing protein n=1 Tax=Bradyrhizobium sp. sGM-13 TaxID=2831781 RepID=UPI001BCAD6A7|nr:VCBS domain-containing protein [Bradyrhizobium sp. sGM-13]